MRFGTPTYGFYKRTLFILLMPFFAVFPLILMFMGSISPMLQEYLVKDANTPLALLQAVETWYKIILLVGIAIGVLILGTLVLHIVLMWKFRDDITPSGFVQGIILNVVFLGLVGALSFAMITRENIPALQKQAQEDIQQITSGQLEVSEVWFNGRVSVEGLPGPYAGKDISVFNQYRGIGESTNHSWESFYLPLFMDFEPREEELFNEYKSVEWNQENATMYRVYHTTNMRIVTEIEAIN